MADEEFDDVDQNDENSDFWEPADRELENPPINNPQPEPQRQEPQRQEPQRQKSAQDQLQLENKLLATIEKPSKSPLKPPKATRHRYVAMNPAQQQLVNFLSGPNRGKEMPAIWRAQLCIVPVGVQDEVPEPDKYYIVKIHGVRSKVLQWSRAEKDPYLHLSINDKGIQLDLVFKRCVFGPWVDSDRPFFALNRALTENDADLFSEAQRQFAELGVVLMPKAPPSEVSNRRSKPREVAPSRSKTRERPDEIARRWREGPQAQWKSADDGVRPGVFENMGNSCYFHSAMLMLYQMKEWYSDQVESAKGDGLEMLTTLDELLESMEQESRVSTELTTHAYNLAQSVLFPLDLNRQQDANEFFVGLLNTMGDHECDLRAITFGARADTFDPDPDHLQEIPFLVHNAQFVPLDLVQAFRTRWNALERKDQDLEGWTLVEQDGTPQIVRRTVRDRRRQDYQPPLQRASLEDPDPTGIQTTDVFRTQDSSETILRVYLPPRRGDVCKLIESTFNNGQDVATGARYGLFNVKTIRHYMYTSLPAKFLIVSMWFNPNKVADKFEYCNAISLAYDGRLFQYDLQCVVFRFGCTADSGHYTAALKVGRRWVYYDDSPPSRKLATIDKLSDISGVPFMLLFKNPRE